MTTQREHRYQIGAIVRQLDRPESYPSFEVIALGLGPQTREPYYTVRMVGSTGPQTFLLWDDVLQ